jgi:hypothetical protein
LTGVGVGVGVGAGTGVMLYVPPFAMEATTAPAPITLELAKDIFAAPALSPFADTVNKFCTAVVHFGIPKVKLGLAQVGVACAIKPEATVMFWQVKLSKLNVPFTTQTLFPAGSMPTATFNVAPTFFVAEKGEIDKVALSA